MLVISNMMRNDQILMFDKCTIYTFENYASSNLWLILKFKNNR